MAVTDLAGTDRWGADTERGVALGLRAVLGVPLTAWGRTIGVLNLHRDRPTRATQTPAHARHASTGTASGPDGAPEQ